MRIVMCKIVRPQNLCDKILECQNKKKIKKKLTSLILSRL